MSTPLKFIMRPLMGCFCLLLLCPTAVLSAGEAADLLHRVHANRADWKGLPGFTAGLRVFAEGRWQEGQLTVAAPDQVTITGIELENERLVHGAIGSLVRHRFSESEEPAEAGNLVLADEQTDHPFGRLIAADDNRQGERFRVGDGILREVLRTSPSGKFTITVLDVYRNPSGQYLPKTYTVTFWDEEGGLKSSSTIQNDWVRVGAWDLPLRHAAIRVGANERNLVRVEFHDHAILDN